ncbi:MAG: MBL fold metallo-hydrolase [Prochlorococcaceae cyanobacterium]
MVGSPAPAALTSLPAAPAALEPGRPPQQVLEGLWCFAPSRDLQGGTAWRGARRGGRRGVDGPPPPVALGACLAARHGAGGAAAGGHRIVLTSREGHGRVARWQERLGWPVLVQEQDAYLLPNLPGLIPWGLEHEPCEGVRLLWTPGPTPGSCVAHGRPPASPHDLLFCGRLLAATAPERLAPLRQPRTFHWSRQLRSLVALQQWLPAGSPEWIACGGGLGALRGPKLVGKGAALLEHLAHELATAA